jgi:hypothetical protein
MNLQPKPETIGAAVPYDDFSRLNDLALDVHVIRGEDVAAGQPRLAAHTQTKETPVDCDLALLRICI